MGQSDLYPPLMPLEDDVLGVLGKTAKEDTYPPIMPIGHDAATTGMYARQSLGTQPDLAAQDVLLAERAGLPAPMVARNRDYFKQQDFVNTVQATLDKAPAVRGFYNRDVLHANLLQDDLENAAQFETVHTNFSVQRKARADALLKASSPREEPQGFFERSPTLLWERLYEVALNTNNWLAAGYAQNVQTSQTLEQSILKNHPQLAEVNKALGGDDFSKPIVDPQALQNYMAETNRQFAYDRLKPTGNVVQDVAESVIGLGPQVAVQLGVSAAGGFVPSMLFMGTQIMGSQYGELTKDGEVDPERAFIASLANAGLQAPLETVGIGKVLNIFKATGLGKAVKAGAGSMVTEFVTEWLQAYPEAATTAWAEAETRGRDMDDTARYFFDNIWETTQQGLREGLVASVWGLVGAGGKVSYEYGKYKAGKTDAAFFAALDESAAGSKTRERLPQAYASLVETVTQHGPVDNVYVPATALREAAGNETSYYQLVDKMGLSREETAKAEASGADLEIPLAMYQTHLAGTETSLAIRDHVKFDADGMSLAEQAAFEKGMPAMLADALRQVEADAATNTELDAALAPIAEQLGAVYGKEATSANMALLKARARIAANWWTEAGETLSPAQVVRDKWGLSVEVAETGEPEGGLLQAAMDRTTANSLSEFAQNVAPQPQGRKNYYDLVPDNGFFSGLTVWYPEDSIRHRDRRHPDMTPEDMDRFDTVLRSLTKESVGVPHKGKPRYAGKVLFGHATVEGQAYGVILESVSKDKVLVASYFKDSSNGVKNWFEKSTNKEKAVETPAALWLAQATPSSVDAFPNQPSEVNIGNKSENVKVRGSIGFSDSGAVIRLFRDHADISTFAHEAAHLFMHDMQALVNTGQAPQHVLADMATLRTHMDAHFTDARIQDFYAQTFAPVRTEFVGREFAELSAEEVAQVREVAIQEKLADDFLVYLQDGKAPAPELMGAFRRFKEWLKALYKAIVNPSIPQDVRKVFDRMLATDADMALAEQVHRQTQNDHAAIDKVAQAMLTEQEKKRLKDLRAEASQTAREQNLAKRLKSYFESLLGKHEATGRARKTVNAMPVYAALDNALELGGLSKQSIEELFGEQATKDMAKKRPGLVRLEGGVAVEDIALAHGFESAEAFVDAVIESKGKAAEVRDLVQAELASREAELRKEMGLDEAKPGEEDFYNDSRLKAVLLEMRAMERAAGRTISNGGNAAINRQWARRVLAAMPVRDALSVAKHAAAEARAAGESAKALAEGDMEAAADAKRRQAINHAMVLEALDMIKKQQSFLRQLGRWAKSDTMEFSHQEQILAMAERYGLGGNKKKDTPRYSPRKPDERVPFGQWLDAATEDNIFGAPAFSDFILNETVPKVLTMGQFEELMDVAKWVAQDGSPGEALLITEGTSGSILAAAQQGAETIRRSGNVAPVKEEGTFARAASDKWRAIFAALNEFKDMMMRADGYQEIGKKAAHRMGFHSQWHQRINDAHNAMSRLYRTEIKPEQKRIEHIRDGFIRRFEKQFGKRTAAIGGVTTPENMRGIGRSNWTAEHIWCIARNMGNEGNLKTLTEGFGLNMDSLRALTSVLTANEWQAIQTEGNLLGRFYEETDAVFRKVYGRPMPDKVQPTELTVNTADGQALTLPGWYYPISVDGRLDPDIADKQQIDILQADPNVTAFGPSLKRAHTKARSGTSKPVNLAFDVFERSMEDQLRFMTHAPVLRDFDRMTRNKEWRKAYTEAFGEQAYGEIRPMLKYLARPQSEMNGSMDGFLARQRQLASLFILGHNVKTFVRQFQGVMQAVPDLGMGPILRGMGRVYISPRGAVAAINELSPFMADRDLGFNRELREATRAFKAAVKVRIGDKTYTEAHVHEFTMSLVRIGDQLAVYPIWQGAFMKAQNELGMSQKDAVVFADRIIQKSNASATPVDLTPLQREGGAWRLFTMFMGEPLRKGSRIRYWWNAMHAGKIGVGEYTGHLVMETVVPALFFVGLVGLLSDDEPDWQDVSIATLGELTGSIPLLSQLSGALQYNKPLTQSSVFTGVEAAMKLGKATYSVWDDPDNQEAWSRFFKSSVDLTAYTAGVGNVRRVYETAAEGWEALQFGQTHNPFRVFFRQPKDAK